MLGRNATLACMATRTFDGPFWRLVLEAEGDVLTGIRWAAQGERPRIQGNSTLLNDPARQLERYFAGRLKRFDLKIQPSGSPNPIAVVTPCHGVLASGGAIGGYSGGRGLATKRKLLALEGVVVP